MNKKLSLALLWKFSLDQAADAADVTQALPSPCDRARLIPPGWSLVQAEQIPEQNGCQRVGRIVRADGLRHCGTGRPFALASYDSSSLEIRS